MGALFWLIACGGSETTTGEPSSPSDPSTETTDPTTPEPTTPEPTTPEPTTPEPTTPTTTIPAEPLPICVNEILPDNAHGWLDETGADPDWIELHNPTAADVPLDGWTISDDGAIPGGWPLDGLVVPAGGFLVLAADGDPTLGPTHLDFSLAIDGEDVALWAPDGRGSVVTYGAMASDRALARETDCCEGSGCWIPTQRPTPGASNAGSLLPTVWVDRAATFRYLDGYAAPDPSWNTPSYDDAAWLSGPAPLGYGDVQTTVIDGGDPANRPASAFFRTTFQVPDPAAVTAARLRLRYDDGAVIWLNGVQIFADGAPEVPGGYASKVREAPVEGRWHEAEIWRNALVAGDNVLAVQVSQGSADSDDLRLELELRASP